MPTNANDGHIGRFGASIKRLNISMPDIVTSVRISKMVRTALEGERQKSSHTEWPGVQTKRQQLRVSASSTALYNRRGGLSTRRHSDFAASGYARRHVTSLVCVQLTTVAEKWSQPGNRNDSTPSLVKFCRPRVSLSRPEPLFGPRKKVHSFATELWITIRRSHHNPKDGMRPPNAAVPNDKLGNDLHVVRAAVRAVKDKASL